MPTTRVVITKDGKVYVEGLGYSGSACVRDLERLTKRLKELGVDVVVEAQEKKPEYYVSQAMTAEV